MNPNTNPGTNFGNESRIRQLEAAVRTLTLQQNNTLEMLRRAQRYGGGGGAGTVIVIARATADVTATDSTFSAKIKATICGPPQTFDADITVENLAPGDFTTPTVSGDYLTTSTENVFLLLEGQNFIAAKANTDSVSFPGSGAPKTGWFIIQAPGTYADC
jgi:hypothetical protein